MPVITPNALIPLAGQHPRPVSAFFDAREQTSRTKALNAQTDQIEKATIEASRKAKQAAEMESIARAAMDVHPLFERALRAGQDGDLKGLVKGTNDIAQMLADRVKSIARTGGNTDDTMGLLELMGEETGDGQALMNGLSQVNQAIEVATRFGVVTPPGGVTFAPKLGAGVVTKTVGPDGKDIYSFESPVLSAEGFTTRAAPLTGTPVSRIGESGADLSERLVEQATDTAQAETDIKSAAISGDTEAQVRARKQEERHQQFIKDGLSAADALPILNRGLELLKSVETGGYDAANRWVRSILGIESADQVELNSNLGKAVLAQLKSLFGAAFSEKEGARLEGIEAGFGKSTAGNIRLLKQQIRNYKREARRGQDSADFTEDPFSRSEIQRSMDFNLNPISPTGPGGKILDVNEDGDFIDAEGNIVEAQFR